MKIIIILSLFLVVIIDGKPTADWSVSSDSTMIEECLRKSLKKINAGEDFRTSLEETTNVVCHTKVNNGINIKLTFDFRKQRWECSLYKSFVDALDVQYENCMKVDKTSKSLEASQTNNNEEEEDDEEEDDEAKIDEMNQEIKDKDQEDKPEDSEVEEDDEAKADETDQEVKNTEPEDQPKDTEEDDRNTQVDDDDDDDPEEPEEDKKPVQNNLGLGEPNQDNLGIGGPNQNTDSDEDNNQNLQGRQSNVGLDREEGAMTNVGNQDEDEDDSKDTQLNSKAYEQLEADQYSDKRFNFAGKNHDEAKDNDGDDISDNA